MLKKQLLPKATHTLYVIDRHTKKLFEEKIFGRAFLEALYVKSWGFRSIQKWIVSLIAHCRPISSLYGWLQTMPWTKNKIAPFCSSFHVDTTEFIKPISAYTSFNDFFIRELKPRPISTAKAIIPADARYRFFDKLSPNTLIDVKGVSLNLRELLQDDSLAKQFEKGTLVSARLAPPDYHRFHAPSDGKIVSIRSINGPLFSVNPLATQQDSSIYSRNARSILTLDDTPFGRIVYIAIGATNVGSIHWTKKPNTAVKKADELGYFSFGGSQLILLFKENKFRFAPDLILENPNHLEIYCRFGQSLSES